jgi:hypothetical protein
MLYAYADLNNRIYAVLEATASPDHEHTILVSSRDVLGKKYNPETHGFEDIPVLRGPGKLSELDQLKAQIEEVQTQNTALMQADLDNKKIYSKTDADDYGQK